MKKLKPALFVGTIIVIHVATAVLTGKLADKLIDRYDPTK